MKELLIVLIIFMLGVLSTELLPPAAAVCAFAIVCAVAMIWQAKTRGNL